MAVETSWSHPPKTCLRIIAEKLVEWPRWDWRWQTMDNQWCSIAALVVTDAFPKSITDAALIVTDAFRKEWLIVHGVSSSGMRNSWPHCVETRIEEES